MRVGGVAREFARVIAPAELTNGGMLNGAQVEPVTYVLGNLHFRFGALEDESHFTSMTEVPAFSRRP
eukprot:6395472-Lingulodinium_polyedra.AAC.1